MRTIIRYGLLGIFSLFLLGCDDSDSYYKQTGKYAPLVNPSPKYYLHVSGEVPKEKANSLIINWEIVYSTNTPECRKYASRIEGASFPRESLARLTTKPDKDGRYNFQLPLDYYSEGYCKWRPYNVNYTIDTRKHFDPDKNYYYGIRLTTEKIPGSESLQSWKLINNQMRILKSKPFNDSEYFYYMQNNARLHINVREVAP